MTPTDAIHGFISCAPGLEACLLSECIALGLKAFPPQRAATHSSKGLPGEEPGGMEFSGSFVDIYRSNLHLRTASRVVVRLGEFYAASFSELRKKASRLPWETFIKPAQTVTMRVVCHKSKLYHSDAVAERVLNAINDHFSHLKKSSLPVKLDPQGQLILVRLVNDHCTISIDSSGDLLHRRGYRLETAKAPLRETLAAGLLLASGWDGTSPLIDPFCGSGTIPIEAAILSQHIPPGIARKFRFMDWFNFSHDVWNSVLEHARKNIKTSQVQILGYDRDAGAIEIAAGNAMRAAQKDNIIFQNHAVSYLRPTSEPGWVVTNPPYGRRLHEGKDLRNLYARFGSLLTTHFHGWKVAVLSSDDHLLGNLGLGKPLSCFHTVNGGISVELALYEIQRSV